jgi:L-fuconate dehydratase
MLSPEDAIDILKAGQAGKAERIAALARSATDGGGYPAYTTSPGWTGLDDETMVRLTKEALAEGFDTVKMKVGRDLEEDKRRLRLCRDALGPDNRMGTDANQVFEVGQAIEWMTALAGEVSEGGLPVAPLFIEEPLSPHDAVGHATIRKALKGLGVGVATGEQCANRVMWKQMFALGAVDIAQLDFARLAGASEFVLVLLMARKSGVAVWPHAGGVGLCEGVQHLMLFDAAAVSALDDPWGSGRRAEFVDHLHEKFTDPCRVVNGRYEAPTKPGFSLEMYPSVVAENVFPTGSAWTSLLASGAKAVPTAMDAVATAVKSADAGPSAMGASASAAASSADA